MAQWQSRDRQKQMKSSDEELTNENTFNEFSNPNEVDNKKN